MASRIKKTYIEQPMRPEFHLLRGSVLVFGTIRSEYADLFSKILALYSVEEDLIIDLSECTLISTPALQVLIERTAAHDRRSTLLTLTGVRRRVADIIHSLSLESLLVIQP